MRSSDVWRVLVAVVAGSLLLPVTTAVADYSSGFDAEPTGAYPAPWQHHQQTNCGYSDCNVGHNYVIDTDAVSGGKSLECREESNGNRLCYIEVDVTADTTISFDYKLHVSDSWSTASVRVTDTSFNKLEQIIGINHGGDSSSETVGWGAVTDYDLSAYAGQTVYIGAHADGRHSGGSRYASWVRLDNVAIDSGTTPSSILKQSGNTAAPAGATWIEGSDLHWADGTTEYWLQDAPIVTTSSGGQPGAFWIDGAALHWIDASGDKRRYDGPVTDSAPGGPTGSMWIEDGLIHYIDAAGQERETDGT